MNRIPVQKPALPQVGNRTRSTQVQHSQGVTHRQLRPRRRILIVALGACVPSEASYIPEPHWAGGAGSCGTCDALLRYQGGAQCGTFPSFLGVSAHDFESLPRAVPGCAAGVGATPPLDRLPLGG